MEEEVHAHREEEAGVRGGAAAAYAPAEAYARPVGGVLAFTDRVRWAAVWAGWLTYFALWIWFTAIGFAIWLGAAASPSTAFGPGFAVWTGVAGLIALFLGGVIMSRLAGIAGAGNGVWNGVVLWGLSFTLLMIMASLGTLGAGGVLGSLFGGVPRVPTGTTTPGMVQVTATTSAWLFVVFEFLGLIFAAAGGATGARAAAEEGQAS